MKPKQNKASQKQIIYAAVALVVTSVCIHTFQTKLNTPESSFVLFFNQYHQVPYDTIINFISDLSTPLLIVVALLALYMGFVRKQEAQKQFGIFLSGAFAMNAISTTLLKHAVARVRPFHINELIDKLGSGGSYSFPSGHSADAILLAMVVWRFFPDKTIRFLAVCWFVLIPFTRIYLGVHYPSDVLGSFLIAWMSMCVAKNIENKTSKPS